MGIIGALIVTLVINVAGGGAISKLFSSVPQPQTQEQRQTREQKADMPQIAHDKAQPNKMPSAEDR